MSNQQEENPIEKMPYGLLISATYKNKKAVLKFYDPKSEKIILWEDKTEHKPYCYTKLHPLYQLQFLKSHNALLH